MTNCCSLRAAGAGVREAFLAEGMALTLALTCDAGSRFLGVVYLEASAGLGVREGVLLPANGPARFISNCFKCCCS